MRTIKAALSPLLLVGLLLLAFVTAGISQDRSPADVSRDLRREWASLAQSRTEFEVSDPELLPSALKLAAEQSDCRYQEGLKLVPARFFSIGDSRLALIPCKQSWKTFQRAFDLSSLQKPAIIRFPILASPDGIGTSADAPGFLTRDTETGFFKAETTSDIAYTTRARYTYRFDGPSNFVVLRVEIQRDGVGDWVAIWDTLRWADFVKPN